MTNLNETMTKAEAQKIFHGVGPNAYPNTEHNLKMMASVVDDFLLTLRPKA